MADASGTHDTSLRPPLLRLRARSPTRSRLKEQRRAACLDVIVRTIQPKSVVEFGFAAADSRKEFEHLELECALEPGLADGCAKEALPRCPVRFAHRARARKSTGPHRRSCENGRVCGERGLMATPPPGPGGERRGQTQLRVLAGGHVRVPGGPRGALWRRRRIRSRTLAFHPGQRRARRFASCSSSARRASASRSSSRTPIAATGGTASPRSRGRPGRRAAGRCAPPSGHGAFRLACPWWSSAPRTCCDGWAPDSELDLLEELRTLTARIAARVVLDAELAGYGPERGPLRSASVR